MGVTTSARGRLEGVVGRNSWVGDMLEASEDAVGGRKSDNELLRFLRVLGTPSSEMPLKEEKEGGFSDFSCPVPGLEIVSSDANPYGRSREAGRRNPRRASTSVDFERVKVPLGVLGSDPAGLCFLLSVRKMEATLLSPSFFEPSLCKPNPKRFRKDEELEPTDPVLVWDLD